MDNTPDSTGAEHGAAFGAESWLECLRAGLQHVKEGVPVKGAALLRKAHELRPDDFPITLNFGAALQRAGDHEEAIAVFDKALKARPHSAAAHHGRGLALNSLGERMRALGSFRMAVYHDRDAWKAWGSIADLTPDEDDRLNAMGEAADALLRACHGAGDGGAPRFECANALIDAHRYREAESFVKWHVTRFQRAPTAHDLLSRIAYYRGDFEQALNHKQHALLALPPEGIPTEPELNAFEPDAALDALQEISGILAENDIGHFPAAGTLLGFVRHGGPLPHDRDVDIGVIRDADGSPDIAAILRDHPDTLMPRGARSGDRYFGFTLKGVAIDIFLHDRIDGGLVCGVSDVAGDIQWRFSDFTLTAATFEGMRWSIPDSAERYLAESYGETWRTPDKGFASVISSPSLYKVDDHARAYYCAARAKKSLLIGDIEKAAALIRQSPLPLPVLSEKIAEITDRDDAGPQTRSQQE